MAFSTVVNVALPAIQASFQATAMEILTMLGQRTLLQALTELESRESAKRTTRKVRLSVQNKR